jgi:hypothetical protein
MIIGCRGKKKKSKERKLLHGAQFMDYHSRSTVQSDIHNSDSRARLNQVRSKKDYS